MPWNIGKHTDCNGFAVIKDSDGSLAGCHETEEDAKAQMAALYASEQEAATSQESDRVDNIKANVVDKVYRTSWEGKDWLVVPTVMIKEGVLNGEYVPAEELAKYPGAWDGRPFVVDHPRDGEAAVSANDPEMVSQYQVGQLFGTEFVDGALKSEIWLDLSRAKNVDGGQDLVRRVLNGDKIEVSTGYFRDLDQVSGSFNGEQHVGIARNLRPDHLAALLDSVGACSWQDGCGCPRVNECEKECKGECSDRMVWTQPTELAYNVEGTVDTQTDEKDVPRESKALNAFRAFLSTLGINVDGEAAHQEEMEAMAKSKEDLAGELRKKLELNADDESLSSLSAGTLRKILNAMTPPEPDKEPEDDTPDEEEEPMPNDEAQTPAQEPEQETAEEQETEQPAGEPQANEQPCADARFAALEEQIKALERRNAELAEWIETAGPVVQEHQEAQASEKTKLVSDLAANERCAFDESELKQWDVPRLQKLARSLMPRNYGGQEGGPTVHEKEDTRPVVMWDPRAGKE